MRLFEKIFKPKPDQETRQHRRRFGTSPEDVAVENAEVEERRKKALEEGRKADEAREAEIERAKQKFQIDANGEKHRLKLRLGEIPSKIKELEQGLVAMRGPEMSSIVDKEYDLNSAM